MPFPTRGSNTELIIVGQRGGTNVGASLERAASRVGLETRFVDAHDAWAAPRAVRAFTWRFRGHRPPRLSRTSRQLVELCRQAVPRWVLCTGLAPVDATALAAIGKMGIRRLNYLTDDPWNRGHAASWFFEALREYDCIYSVRTANLQDLVRHGCAGVSYLPFGFDPQLAWPEDLTPDERARFDADVVFVGGADRDRVPYIVALIRAGLDVHLYGDYWSKQRDTRRYNRGHADPATVRKATAGAKVALCLVRLANRDGQVMRSYEAGAMGACMLVEDTPEHRALFGSDGECVVYFEGIENMVGRLSWLLEHADERRRLGAAVRQRISTGHHTYDDRLRSMLAETGA